MLDRMFVACVTAFVMLASAGAQAATGSAKHVSTDKNGSKVFPLQDVISAVVDSLRDYQNQAGSADQPTLSTAEFDFKTVVDTQIQGGISLWIITLKAGKTTDTTTEVNFSYKLPSPVKPQGANLAKPGISFEDALAKTISDAASAAAKNPSLSVGNKTYSLCQLTTTVAFAVKVDANGGVSFPISLVTASASLDRNRSDTQQVKLTFDTGNLACHPTTIGKIKALVTGH